MSKFLNSPLSALEPYTPGEQPPGREYIKLNTNESPYFPSKYAVEKIGCAELENLRLYSDPECLELSEAIAQFYNVKKENVLPANGSDEALAFCFSAFCGEGAIFPDITYGFYRVFAKLFGVGYKEAPLNPDFTVDTAPYLSCSRTVFLANPNAQTGIYLDIREIEKIVKSNPQSVVVVDEAYVDFGAVSCVPLIKKYDNLIVVQTFSKSRSLAGARVGFAVACESLTDDLKRVKFSFNPYNVNRLSGALAAEAIKDEAYFKECVEKIISTRKVLTEGLEALGFTVLPSQANFVLAGSEKISGENLYKRLKERGILVRHFPDRRINNFVRITVGDDGQIQTLLKTVKQILEERNETGAD